MQALFYKSSPLLLLILLASCSSAIKFAEQNKIQSREPNFYFEEGLASFYDDRFVGRITASGEIYTHREYTAAHRHLPFGTIVKVLNLENGKVVNVRINDRGPFVKGRIIDLSKSAAKDLEMLDDGVVRVRIEVIK
ncbi:MAG: septal ring lytic transglycosylase RlpA family protein [Ignavibacteria bacterium]|nr:septal ring lytic transglycosylase RlpA family protein [Ignavibacteria bacterium]